MKVRGKQVGGRVEYNPFWLEGALAFDDSILAFIICLVRLVKTLPWWSTNEVCRATAQTFMCPYKLRLWFDSGIQDSNLPMLRIAGQHSEAAVPSLMKDTTRQ